jgi:2-amino-4-hydroxy-6-hydroxymethyldihydropteridine diphosphokinase
LDIFKIAEYKSQFSNKIGPFLNLKGSNLSLKDHLILTGLKVSCIIGIFEWERKQKQDVIIDLKFPCDSRRASRHDFVNETVDYKKIAKFTISFVEKSNFKLIETLAERLATLLIKNFNLPEIDLTISKPGAIRGSQNVGVQIQRFSPNVNLVNKIFLSLGSNINPQQNLEKALVEIQKTYSLIGLSHVYETSPVGFSKQSSFWNLAIAMETDEEPIVIQKWIKILEKKAGRQRSFKKFGPRTLDIDLLLWGDLIEKNRNFSLPHADIEKKAFVLFPLLEISPNMIHPILKKPMIELAAAFKDSTQKIRQLSPNLFEGFPPQKL